MAGGASKLGAPQEHTSGDACEYSVILLHKNQALLKTNFRETSSEIRNPDGSLVFKHDAIEVPASWSQVACDVLAQKYFRKAGIPARLKRVEENDLPSWLWRSVPILTPLKICPKKTVMSVKHLQNKCLTVWQVAGPTGAGKAAISTQKPMLTHIMTKWYICCASKCAHQTLPSGLTQACTGPTGLMGRLKGITTSISRRAS